MGKLVTGTQGFDRNSAIQKGRSPYLGYNQGGYPDFNKRTNTDKEGLHTNKPFWNKLLTEASKQLRNLRKVFNYKYNSSWNGIALEKANETFKNLSRDSAADWMSEHLADLGHQKGKSFWDSFKKIFGNQRAGDGPVHNLNEQVLTATEDIAMEFRRTFFETRHLQNQVFDDNHFNMINHDVQKLPECSQHALLEDDILENEIDTALRNGTKCSSLGNGEFYPRMFKHVGPKFKGLLLQLYNECWQKSNWPWMKTRISFIRKSNKTYLLCSSFRPLSIGSHFGKLFERIIERRLRKWLEANNCISPAPEGFQPKKSTVRSLYRLNLLIEKTIRKPAALLNIDMEKAFDSVWINGMMHKLKEKGVVGKLLAILHAFLKNIAYIQIDKDDTSEFKIETGLPQGSVLSPVLFVLYIDDFLKDWKSHFKFADDSSVLIETETTRNLNAQLNNAWRDIENWCSKWRMAVNYSKTADVNELLTKCHRYTNCEL